MECLSCLMFFCFIREQYFLDVFFCTISANSFNYFHNHTERSEIPRVKAVQISKVFFNLVNFEKYINPSFLLAWLLKNVFSLWVWLSGKTLWCYSLSFYKPCQYLFLKELESVLKFSLANITIKQFKFFCHFPW